ncbi:MAG: hypothetical protein ABIA47_04350 [bacterium]
MVSAMQGFGAEQRQDRPKSAVVERSVDARGKREREELLAEEAEELRGEAEVADITDREQAGAVKETAMGEAEASVVERVDVPSTGDPDIDMVLTTGEKPLAKDVFDKAAFGTGITYDTYKGMHDEMMTKLAQIESAPWYKFIKKNSLKQEARNIAKDLVPFHQPGLGVGEMSAAMESAGAVGRGKTEEEQRRAERIG